jgi:Thiamine pyrophosphate enzyme, N-terminal TPP binding domain
MTHRIRIGLADAGRMGQIHAASLSGPVGFGPARDFAERCPGACASELEMVARRVRDGRMRNRLQALACTASIGPGSTNMVTGAALATINRIPVLLLPSDIFATRVASPVLQELEDRRSADVSVNDAFRPVSRFFDRIWRPEQLPSALLAAMRVLTDPAETGAVTLALPSCSPWSSRTCTPVTSASRSRSRRGRSGT